MLRLPDVTLVCYDTVMPRLTAVALNDCMDMVEFGAVHLLTHDATPEAAQLVDRGVRIFPVPSGLDKVEGQRIQWGGVAVGVETSHVLNVEWDAGITDPTMWDDEFLAYDYIGAPWPWCGAGAEVGNGGFTLVSVRLLRHLLEHGDRYPYAFPWDDTLCHGHRAALEAEGFRWPAREVAARFAFEYGEPTECFGYHDCRNWPLMLPMHAIKRRLTAADDFVRKHPAWKELALDLQRVASRMVLSPEGTKHLQRRIVPPTVEEVNRQAETASKRRAYESAITLTRRAIEICPTASVLWSNLASHHWSLRQYREAEDCAKRALRLDPDNHLAWGNLGLALEGQRQFVEAENCFNSVLARDPQHYRTQWDRALLYLNWGRYEEGWRDYEIRIPYRRHEEEQEGGPRVYPHFKMPLWQGEPLAGKTIYVHGEQGIGDNIMLSRFLPWLSAQAARVYFCGHQAATGLFWGYRHLLELIPEGAVIPDYDYAVFLGSLPFHYGVRDVDQVPPDPGLIRQTVSAAMTPTIPEPGNLTFRPLKVGVCWTGNPEMGKNFDRSIPPDKLFSLCEDPRVLMYSFQVGEGEDHVAHLGMSGVVCDALLPFYKRHGLVGTGATLLQMDLVITCCTSVAHLAAALGVPTWVLLCEDPYWAWGRALERSPWWPEVRMYRQEAPHDWEAVIGRVRTDLAALTATR